MSLALQHSTYAAIYDLVARAMFLKAVVLLLFISEISLSDSRGKLSLVYCHCSCILISFNKVRIFEGGNNNNNNNNRLFTSYSHKTELNG